MKKYLAIIFVFISLLACIGATAQDYPVNVTTVLTPPYSLYLSDYSSADGNAMQAIIQLRELDRPEYKVKLRITIEGEGITLRTSAGFHPNPLILQGGIPEILTGYDLRQYLNPDNLEFSGISRQEFVRKGTFPEGFYTFKIEVIDYIRNVVVSNPGFANAWIVLNDPPIINLPFDQEKVRATDPQNVMFSWTSRHTASPNAAFSTEYEFRLVELFPENRNPDDAIRASNSIFVTQTQATSLNYGMMEPMLIPGRKYAFRIRAYDTGGKDLFKNDGYSEVHVFQFGDACLKPTAVSATALGPDRIKLTWDPLDTHTVFDVKYSESGTDDWHEADTYANSKIIPGLKGLTTYEYQVKGVCGTIHGEYSDIEEVATLAAPENEFSCGAEVPEFDISTSPLPLGILQVDDLIKTADFEITVSALEANGDGSYRGEGYAFLPWLNFASVRVKFANIRVNEDYRVYSGNVTTIYSPGNRFVVDLGGDDKLNESDEPSEEEEDNDSDESDIVDVVIEDDIVDVHVDDNGDIIIETADGGTEIITPESDPDTGENKDTRIEDENGDVWTVEDGNVSGGSGNGADTPDGTTETDSVLFVQKELIKEILQHFKEEINVLLENSGKGPLDEVLIRRLLAVPDCLPEDEEQLEAILAKIEEYLKDPETLLNLVKEGDENRDRIEELTTKLAGKQPPYAAGLSETEWDELTEMICPYLIEEEQIQYHLPLTVSVDKDYYLVDPEKMSFTDGDTIAVHDYMEGVTLFVTDSAKQEITLSGENFPDIGGTIWEPGFIINIEELAQDSIRGFKLMIKEVDTLQLYIVKKVPTEDLAGAELEAFKDDAQDGIDDGETWNPKNYACNNAVRAFLYHHKADAVLFPETMTGKADDFRYGSGLSGPNDATVLKGDISWDGTADKMWDDFSGNGNDLTGSFTEIAKNSTETWNAYFDRLQKEANKGTVIVGVVHSDDRTSSRGHVVALMPKSLCGDEDAQRTVNKVGETTEKGVKLPCALEAGGDFKEIKWFAQSTKELDDYKWFKYED